MRFGGVHAVDGAGFTVEHGQVVGLIGPNGCGKTTTLRTVAGLLRPDAGRVVVNGIAQGSTAARGQVVFI